MFLREEKSVFPELVEFLSEFLKKRGKDPPLVITSKPVAVEDILTRHSPKKGLLLSTIIHIAIAVSLLVLGKYAQMSRRPASSLEIFMISPNSSGISSPLSLKRGGGGGGDRSPQPASKGKSPKVSLKQLAPPAAEISNEQPKLAVEPTIIAPPELQSTVINFGQLGDVFAQIALPSGGPGFGGGTGSGGGGGIGPGSGLGIGPGSGSGAGGDVSGVGNGVIAPRIIRKVNPEYSDEARKERYQGTVVLYVEIDTDGNVRKIEVRKRLGLGLDEKAMEAVRQWKFSPGTKDDQPVVVAAIVEVIFRLL